MFAIPIIVAILVFVGLAYPGWKRRRAAKKTENTVGDPRMETSGLSATRFAQQYDAGVTRAAVEKMRNLQEMRRFDAEQARLKASAERQNLDQQKAVGDIDIQKFLKQLELDRQMYAEMSKHKEG